MRRENTLGVNEPERQFTTERQQCFASEASLLMTNSSAVEGSSAWARQKLPRTYC